MYICMESRKMVLMNLFSRKEWRRRPGEWTCGHSGGRRGGTKGGSSIKIHTPPGWEGQLVRSCAQHRSPGCDDGRRAGWGRREVQEEGMYVSFWVVHIVRGFPDSSAGKEFTCSTGDLSSMSGLGRSHGEGKGSPLQYSGLENSMDWTVRGVAKSQTRLSDFHSLTHSHCCMTDSNTAL